MFSLFNNNRTDTIYYPNGERKFETEYFDGKVVRRSFWNLKGVKRQQQEYCNKDDKAIGPIGSLKKINYYWPNNNLAFEYKCIGWDDTLKYYYQSGALFDHVQFTITEDKKTIENIGYFENGTKMYEVKHIDGVPNGKTMVFYKNGNLMHEKTYKEKNGYKSIYWSEGGIKILEMECKADEENGKVNFWFENGSKKTESEFIRELDQNWNIFDTFRSEQYLKGALNLSPDLDQNRNRIELDLEDFEECLEEYNMNNQFGCLLGNLNWHFDRCFELTKYCNDSKEFEDVCILNGKRIEWFENGKIKSESEYKVGKLNGMFRSWNEEGQMISEVFYREGIAVEQIICLDSNQSKKSIQQDNIILKPDSEKLTRLPNLQYFVVVNGVDSQFNINNAI